MVTQVTARDFQRELFLKTPLRQENLTMSFFTVIARRLSA